MAERAGVCVGLSSSCTHCKTTLDPTKRNGSETENLGRTLSPLGARHFAFPRARVQPVFPGVSDEMSVRRHARAMNWRSAHFKVPSLDFPVLFEDVLAIVGWWVFGRELRGRCGGGGHMATSLSCGPLYVRSGV